MRQVGERPAFDRAAPAIALAQQIGRGRISVRPPRDIHASVESNRFVTCQALFANYMPTSRPPIRLNPSVSAAFRCEPLGNFGLESSHRIGALVVLPNNLDSIAFTADA